MAVLHPRAFLTHFVPFWASSARPRSGCAARGEGWERGWVPHCGAGTAAVPPPPVPRSGAMGTLPQPRPAVVTLRLLPQVRDWTQDESSNRGLLVTVHGLGGSALEAPAVQFASSGDHHESKKPMLVLFTDDGRRGASLPMAGVPGGCHTARGRARVPVCRLQLWLSPNVAMLGAVPTPVTTVGLRSRHLPAALQ